MVGNKPVYRHGLNVQRFFLLAVLQKGHAIYWATC